VKHYDQNIEKTSIKINYAQPTIQLKKFHKKMNKINKTTQKSVETRNKNLTMTYPNKDLQPSHVMGQKYIKKME